MYFFKIFLGLLFLSLGYGSVYACAPCLEKIDLSQSIAEADIIAVVQRDGRSDKEKPDYIDLHVHSLLKGSWTGGLLHVSSRVGEMCPYGIIIQDDSEYLVLLERGNGTYNAVHQGCGIGAFSMVDGQVQSDGGAIDLKTFAQSRGLTITPMDDGLSWWGRLWQWLFG